jgi:hypothetical protein
MNNPTNCTMVPMKVNYNTINTKPTKYTPDPCIFPFLVKNFIMPVIPIKKYNPIKNKTYLTVISYIGNQY